MPRYEVQTRATEEQVERAREEGDGSASLMREWSPAGTAASEFATREEAEAAIPSLRDLGDEWAVLFTDGRCMNCNWRGPVGPLTNRTHGQPDSYLASVLRR